MKESLNRKNLKISPSQNATQRTLDMIDSMESMLENIDTVDISNYDTISEIVSDVSDILSNIIGRMSTLNESSLREQAVIRVTAARDKINSINQIINRIELSLYDYDVK